MAKSRKNQNKKDMVRVIASRASSVDSWSAMQYLPNPDPILKKMGKDIVAYREILVDATVGSAVKRRKSAIKELDWRIVEETPSREGEILHDYFNRIDLNQLLNELLDACLYGYSPLEMMWAVQDGLYLPEKIIGKPPEWFVFDDENQLRFRTKEEPTKGEALPPNKFLLAVQNGSYNNPYGMGDLALCFWPAIFKRGGLKYWFEFAEKYGAPWVVGKHKRSDTDQQIEVLLDALELLMGNSVGAIPDDSSVEIMTTGGSSSKSGEAYENLLRYCRSEISIALLGQNQTTESDTNHASATAGLEVANSLRNDDAKMVMGVINTQLIPAIYELNFNSPVQVKFELYEQESIDKLQAERDKLLSESGVTFTNQYWQRTYGLEDGDLQEQTVQKPVNTTASFAEPDQVDEPEIILENALKLLPNPIADWRGQIFDFFKQHGAKEARDRLAELMPELDDTELTKQLAQVIFVSGLYGRLTAKAEQE